MRLVIQRVTMAKVEVNGQVVGEIGPGLLVLVGIAQGDTPDQIVYCAQKTAGLRIFEDPQGKMNLSVADLGYAVLAVPQFTLLGDAREGNRPSFSAAERPIAAQEAFEQYKGALQTLGVTVQSGAFREHMAVSLNNDGPVTILVDSRRAF